MGVECWGWLWVYSLDSRIVAARWVHTPAQCSVGIYPVGDSLAADRALVEHRAAFSAEASVATRNQHNSAIDEGSRVRHCYHQTGQGSSSRRRQIRRYDMYLISRSAHMEQIFCSSSMALALCSSSTWSCSCFCCEQKQPGQ